MNIDKKFIDSVDRKLNHQNAILACLGAAFWSIPTIALWTIIYTKAPNFGVMMFILSGSIIGLAVRFHGKGMKRLFSTIAFITYTWVAVMAYTLGIVLHGTTWAIFLLGAYVAGAFIAVYLAKKEVPFEEHRAHTKLTSLQIHNSEKNSKNKWFIALPILIIASAISSYLAITSFYLIKDYEHSSQILKRQQNVKNKNKAIEVTPDGLASRTTKEALRYSYAYYSGLLFDKKGKYTQPYPRSEFKAKTILRYLVKSRDNARAKYILGLLSTSTNGLSLIQQAVKQRDKYAQIYSAINYGCNVDNKSALDLLVKLKKVSNEQYIREEIESIIYINFPEICNEISEPEFLPSYVLNYSESTM